MVTDSRRAGLTSRRGFLSLLGAAALAPSAPSAMSRALGLAPAAGATIHCAPGLLAIGTLITIEGLTDSAGVPMLFRITKTVSGGRQSFIEPMRPAIVPEEDAP